MSRPIEQGDEAMELVALKGEQLSAVTFVRDYLQLVFDGPTITAITWPVVVGGDGPLGLGALGYRDRLCELIGRGVARAFAKPGDRLQVDFEKGTSLVISLRPETYRAAEAAIFSDGKGEQWGAW